MASMAPPSLLFFCNSILFISFFTRLPAIQEGLGIDKAVLGLALLGAPAGTFLALPVAGRVTDWLTPRRAAALMLGLNALILPLMALSPLWFFPISLVLFGFTRTILDVASNMIATGIEQGSGRKILARSHAFWSIGLLAGTLFSGFLAGRGVSAFHHMSLILVPTLIACVVALKITGDHPAPHSDVKRSVIILPSRSILLICLMIFGISIVEGAIYDWGTFYLREVMKADPQTAALLYSAFTIGMGLTRLTGDRLRDLFTPRRLVMGSAICAAGGLLLLIVSSHLISGAVGLFMIGCGVALNAPLAISTAVSLPGRPASENLAALALTMLLATLGIPPLLGIVAEHAGLQISFALLLQFLIVTMLMSPVSEGKQPGFVSRFLPRRR